MTVIPMSGGNWHTDPFSGRPCFTLSALISTAGTYKSQVSSDGTNWTDAATLNVTIVPFVWSTTVSLDKSSVALRIVQ